MNPALVPVRLALQLQTALLGRADLVFEFAQAPAQMRDLVFGPQDMFRTAFHRSPLFFDGGLLVPNPGLEHVKLMASKLGVEMLQFGHELLAPARLAGLALERTDLPLHFTNQVANAQQVLFGVFQFAKRLPLLRLEFGDARRLLEN